MLLTGFPVDMYHKKDQEKKLDRIVPFLLLVFFERSGMEKQKRLSAFSHHYFNIS